MADPRLVDWIKSNQSKGFSERQIRLQLIKNNYKKKDIDEAFAILKNKAPANDKISDGGIDFWDKLNYLLTNPNLFFEKIKSEEGMKNAFAIFAMVSFSAGIINYGVNYMMRFILPSPYGIFGYFFSGFLGLFPLVGIFMQLFMSFLYSGIIHLIIKAFKGTGSYSETYKVYAYSMIPFLVLSLIPLIGGISIVYSFVLMIIGIATVHNISKGKSALACLMPAIFAIGLAILLIIMIFSGFYGIF